MTFKPQAGCCSGFVLAGIFLLSCHNESSLRPACGLACWEYAKSQRGVGLCRDGHWACDESGFVTECVGQEKPSYETCNNEDDDCDGETDEKINIATSRTHGACLSLGVCEDARATCRHGQWKCDYSATGWEAQEQTCDGLDNDCDGFVDERDVATFCYDGTPATLTYNPCRPGVLSCFQGQTMCRGQVLPQPEICDGLDNDCDGTADNLTYEIPPQDIVIMVDTSWSMEPEFPIIKAALTAYLSNLPAPVAAVTRVALIDFAYGVNSPIHVVSDFVPPSAVLTSINNLPLSVWGLEASLDVLKDTCTRALALTWRPQAIVIGVMFTDEPAQSARNPASTDQEIVQACVSSQTLLMVWANVGPTRLQNIALDSGGLAYELPYLPDTEQLYQELNGLTPTVCGGE